MYRRCFFAIAVFVPLLIGVISIWWREVLWSLVVVAPIVLLGVRDILQRHHALLRVYPIIGHGRYLMEAFRPEINQYFVESNIDGTPYNREFRSVIYQRAKGELDTLPFGTQRDVQRVGYEWVNHTLATLPPAEDCARITVGGPDCTQPYDASYLNISAMSYGALSRNAIMALNRGAKAGGFAHNTGEGGISSYHLKYGGDLIWQIGTGYFGCRTRDGKFDPGKFRENAGLESVKMIEIKLSQGAKPGHGGILPKAKLTPEIAEARGVPLGEDVISPPVHTTFATPTGLLEFIARLRESSGGKPVGFKLCVGHRPEFLGICKAMLETGIYPDFITVDGAEGGTGAAPVELSNSVGTPLRHGLLFVKNALTGIGARDKIRVIAAGKISTGFHIFRMLALGADLCNAARAMMFALGCIQARRCNDNTCPVGVTTQNPARVVGLHVGKKSERVARYHRKTIESFCEIVRAVGLESPLDIRPEHIYQQADQFTATHFGALYEHLEEGCLLESGQVPEGWREDMRMADADRFGP